MRRAAKLLVPFVLSFSSASWAQQTLPSSEAAPAAPEQTRAPAASATPSAAPASTATPASAPAPQTIPAPAVANTASTPEPLAAPPATAPAVEPSDCTCSAKRRGFYLRFAGGPSIMAVKGTGPLGRVSSKGGGENSTLAIGGSVARGWVLAGVIHGSAMTNTLDGGPFADATVSADGETTSASAKAAATFSHVGMLVDWYPNPSKGWHVGASAGLGVAGVINQADDSTMSGASAAGSAFGGYDWSIGPDWSLGLGLVASGNTSTKMLDSDGDSTGYRLKSYSVGITGSILYF